MEITFDLAIIGGGPAGTAAAIAAQSKGLKVVIWERQRFPHDKVCGEFLSGESLSLLEQLAPQALRRSAPIARCEFISRRGRVSRFVLPHPGRGLSRRSLDHILWQAAAEAGAHVHEAVLIHRVERMRRSSPADARWRIEARDGQTTQARHLLLACGRWWSLEGMASPGSQRKISSHAWVGFKAHFRGVAHRDAVEMYCFPGGYCGVAPIEDGLYNVCCLVRYEQFKLGRGHASAHDLAGWLRRIAQHPALDARLQPARQAGPIFTTAPIVPRRYRGAHAGALLAGDAGGFIDPFTGDGISTALHSGALAAEVVSRHQHHKLSFSDDPTPEYEWRLRSATAASYGWARCLRACLDGSERLQDATLRLLLWVGPTLAQNTRWRAARG